VSGSVVTRQPLDKRPRGVFVSVLSVHTSNNGRWALWETALCAVFQRPGVPSMFGSLEVKVLCPRSGGDEGLARRKGGDREVPSERSAEAKPRPDGQKPNMRHLWSDEQARICEVLYPSRPGL
jgi:hypothetical protein